MSKLLSFLLFFSSKSPLVDLQWWKQWPCVKMGKITIKQLHVQVTKNIAVYTTTE